MSEPVITVLALLVAGYVLIAMEIFVVPGFGVPGILGLLALGAGCYFANDYFGATYGALSVALVLSSCTAILIWLPKTRLGRGVVLSSSLPRVADSESTLSVGQKGVAESDLRPAGIARFQDRRQSVVTEGEFIMAGATVEITIIQGSRVVVERLAEENGDHPEGG